MREKVKKAITALCEENRRNITVALSGGADSMALLTVLNSLKGELGITLSAAHLNHLIRGDEADRDEAFVKEQCEKLGVELFCERVDVPKIAREQHQSLEMAARNVRYEFLERVATDFIATAHTASDNLETVIYNLARGASLEGLCGIPQKRGRIIRPILECTRKEVEMYCEEHGVPFVTDSTNLADEYTRNKIRHNIVPILKEINPSVEGVLIRNCKLLREDAKFLNATAEKYVFSNTDKGDNSLLLYELSGLPDAVKKRIITRYIHSLRDDIHLENVHIEAVLEAIKNGGKVNLPSNLFATVHNNRLYLEKEALSTESVQFNVTFTEDNVENFENINNLLLNNAIDCDKIVGKLVLRTRLSGDSIRLRNRGCTKTLTRLMSENKVPVALREKIPVISDDNGVIWVYGMGVAQRVAVGSKTRKITVVNTN